MRVDAVKRGKTGKSKSYLVDFGFLIGRECKAVLLSQSERSNGKQRND